MNNDAKLSDKKSIDFRTTRGKRIFSGSCVRYPSQDNHYSLFMAIIALKKVNFICWDKIIYSYLKCTFIFGKSA